MKSTLSVLFSVLFSMHVAFAEVQVIRWTGSDDANPKLSHILSILEKKTGKHFEASDFLLQEGIPLAHSRYERYAQVAAGIPIDGKSIRVWTETSGKYVIQVEAALEDPSVVKSLARTQLREAKPIDDEALSKMAIREAKKEGRDSSIRGIDWKDHFVKKQLVRIFTIRGKHGKHVVHVSIRDRKILNYRYEEFPTQDGLELDALVYPIYEEVEGEGTILNREPRKLKNIYPTVKLATSDIYAPLRQQHYIDSKYSVAKGGTFEGRQAGYWSMNFIKQQASDIRRALPSVINSFDSGLLLEGKYATINIHPDAFSKFTGIDYAPTKSTALFPNWLPTADGESWEMIPMMAYAGKPIQSQIDALLRPAVRTADHNPVKYMNDGFDEIQVYYAIDTLMDELKERGFTDPELSTRPFNAFLYNPDIEYRDNAFYTDDTINFTTYSPEGTNMARDNTTIWHELGHGVMDRLMGDHLVLADTGGLAEGMADFVAELVVQAVTKGTSFPGQNLARIINHTSFFMTNESHDDGEAYGGSMKDFMDAVIEANRFNQGTSGLTKVTDVILEAMRLCRDHPALSAPEWFNHILFADSLGRPGVRAPGELRPYLIKALAGRNFRLDGGKTATFKIYGDQDQHEITASAVGSRYKPIQVTLAPTEVAHFEVAAAVQSSDSYQFKYPLSIRVSYKGSALQGAVHWVGEEALEKIVVLKSEDELAKFSLAVTGTCDYVNREDGSCSDYVSVQVMEPNDKDHPRAKMRFYVQVKGPTVQSKP